MRCLVVAVQVGSWAVALASATRAQVRPAPLTRLAEERKRLVTGEIEWSLRDNMAGRERFYTSQFADDDELLIDRGDAEGIVRRQPDGEPSPVNARLQQFMLSRRHESWSHGRDALSAVLTERTGTAGGLWRLRTLGLGWEFSMADVDDLLWHNDLTLPAERRYDETWENGFRTITAHTDYGAIKWWLDPRRGDAPVRAAVIENGTVAAESRCTLRQFDGVWYPEVIAFYSAAYKEGREPTKVLTVHSAKFNRPDQPQRLSPADIGIEVGVNIQRFKADGSVDIVFWDGSQVISRAEYSQRLRAGELKLGPTVLRELARTREQDAAGSPTTQSAAATTAPATTQPVATESDWEAYTRRFIAKYRLNDDQSQRAMNILHACQQQADAYLERQSDELARLDRNLREAETSSAPDREAAIQRVYDRRATLRKPIDRIFEEQLKPRLETLPTRAQRVAAEGETKPSPTTRPATEP
jgi:hypothetical protein